VTETVATAPSTGLREKAFRLLAERAELVVLAALMLLGVGLALFSDQGVPVGVFGLGAVSGGAVALQAIGIVLVYRSNRLINFAQVPIGLVGGALFFELVRQRKLLMIVHTLSPGSFDLEEVQAGENFIMIPANPPGWMLQVNFWLSLLLSVGLVVLLSYITYTLVIKRFAEAPRLIATVVTIGLAEVFLLIRDAIPRLFNIPGRSAGTVPIPLTLRMKVGGVNFNTTDIITMVLAAVALVALTIFFTRTSLGVVLRGASENPQRAQTLGVNVGAVSSVVWMVAGGLSAIIACLAATSAGVGAVAGTERLLAVAVIGGLVSIPVTVAAGLVFGMADNAIIWVTRSSAIVDVLTLVVIVTVFLLHRSRGARVDTEADGGWKAARETRPIPAELRELEVVRRWLRFGRISGIVVILGLPWLLSPSQTNLAAVTVIYGIIALSLLVLTGWAGQISLGHFAFAAIGAWVTAVVKMPFPLPLILGGIVGAVVATAVGLPALRLRGLHLAVSTIAFAVAVTAVVVNPTYLGKHLPASLSRPKVLGLALEDQRTFYYFALFFLVLVAIAVVGLRRSRTARALIGARDNEPAAQAFGINLVRARLGAFAVSGFFAAFAGGMFAYSQYGVNATSFVPDTSIRIFLMVVIGGLGSVAGPLIGAAYIGMAEIFGQSDPLIALGATGLGVVALLMFAPGGLGELVFKLRDSMLRRVAARYRIDVPSLVADRRRGLGDKVPIEPRTRPGGGSVFTPKRYRPDGQWAVLSRSRNHDGDGRNTRGTSDTSREKAGV
jgi:branched-chain amino acid transport system permease protein